MGAAISAGFVIGLGTGLTCLGWCVPVIVPYTVTAAQPGLVAGLATTSLYCLGRLLAYLGLAAIVLALRAEVNVSPALGAAVTLATGLIVILSGLVTAGFVTWRAGLGRLVCRQAAGTTSPFYLGVLTGLRPCGPLLAALLALLTFPTTSQAVLYMLAFWAGSSVLVVALGLAGGGLAALAGKRLGLARLRSIVGMAMVVIGLYLVLVGIGMFSGESII